MAFNNRLEMVIKEMEADLKDVKGIRDKQYRSMKAYALSGNALTVRRLVNELKGIDGLYERLENITSKASQLI